MAALSISRAWEGTKARIAADGRLFTIVAAALIALPALVAGVLNPGASASEGSLTATLALLISSILAVVGQLAIIRLAVGSTVSVGEAIAHGARRMPIYIVAGLVIAAILAIALVPFAIILYESGVPMDEKALAGSPISALLLLLYTALAMFFGVRMLMSSPVASEEATGPIAILRRSWDLTAGHWWRLFGFMLLFLIAAGILIAAVNWAVGLFAYSLLGPIDPMSASALVVAFAGAIVNSALTVLLAVMLAQIYLQLSAGVTSSVTVPKSGS